MKQLTLEKHDDKTIEVWLDRGPLVKRTLLLRTKSNIKAWWFFMKLKREYGPKNKIHFYKEES